MYGAVLRPRTELVDSGEADMGVLFLTKEGYSVMCGHATLAVSRLLVDNAMSIDINPHISVESIRNRLSKAIRDGTNEVEVRLHVPCGLVRVTVPISPAGSATEHRCDISRPISYLSVPSFAAATGVKVKIPKHLQWPELGSKDEVIADIAYGGTFYIITPPSALGFPKNALAKPDILALSFATKQLKAAFNQCEDVLKLLRREPVSADLQWLYGTILVDQSLGDTVPGTDGAETGICFFSDQQIDRSPTGSGVQARVALEYAKGKRNMGTLWTYHSLVSKAHGTEGAFTGAVVEEHDLDGRPSVIVKVSGWARYTGSCTFVIEEGDRIGKGFWFGEDSA